MGSPGLPRGLSILRFRFLSPENLREAETTNSLFSHRRAFPQPVTSTRNTFPTTSHLSTYLRRLRSARPSMMSSVAIQPEEGHFFIALHDHTASHKTFWVPSPELVTGDRERARPAVYSGSFGRQGDELHPWPVGRRGALGKTGLRAAGRGCCGHASLLGMLLVQPSALATP